LPTNTKTFYGTLKKCYSDVTSDYRRNPTF